MSSAVERLQSNGLLLGEASKGGVSAGRPLLLKELERLDLPHFAQQMEGVAGWIDGTSAMLDQTADFYSEYRP